MSLARTPLVLVALFAVVSALALTATPALAAIGGHVFSTSFGAASNPSLSPPNPYPLSNPADVAVDNSAGLSAHDVYVTDPANHRVEKFDSSGDFILMFGQGVNSGTGNPNVCTNAGAPTDVCQSGTSSSSPGGFQTPTFVAVDGSAGLSAGDVYIGDTGDNLVSKFDSSGNLVASWGTGGQLNGSTATHGPFGSLAGIAVDSIGNLLVYNTGAEMFKFGQSGSFTTDFNTSFGVTASGIAVDGSGNLYIVRGSPVVEKIFPTGSDLGQVTSGGTATGLVSVGSDLYADISGTSINHYGASCNPGGGSCTPLDSFGSGQLTGAQGVAIDGTSGNVYVANTGAGNVAVFELLIVPDVTASPISNPTPTSATLNGHVDPDAADGGGPITDCHYEYGTDTSYSLGTVPCSPSLPYSTPTDVTADLSGLQTLAQYHFRLVATNSRGSGYGPDQTFTPIPNLPLVDSTSSSGVTEDAAALNAQINPGFGDTVYRFQYGNSTSYGSSTLISDSIGSDDTDHAVGSEVTGLTPGTTYHYRVVAINFTGTTHGPDQTFTSTDVPKVSSASASGVTQSTATLGALVNPSLATTTYHFEYGTDASYGSSTPESAPIGSDNTTHPATATLTGLSPATTYHYRVVATNVNDATGSPDQTFTTTASNPVVVPPTTCKTGFVKKQGKCVRKQHHKRHHLRSGRHG